MVNEAAHLLSSSVVSSPSTVDLAMITGAGFPPFTGGLLSYADSRGAEAVVGRLQVLRKAAGERFAPAPLLVKMAENGERFFPERPDPRRLRRVDALPRSRL
jgi:3-hydroxyacyl-CoA dehydrogenase/enoyl-CoA hydratase/3-hydroxybutyryl-CoA epimerase